MLMSFVVTQFRHWKWLVAIITTYFAIGSFESFANRSTGVETVRLQHRMLVETFCNGNDTAHIGDRIMLLHGHEDLMHDPIIKYHTPPGQAVEDILYVNTKFPIAWVICNSSGPGRIAPMKVSPDYQSGMMKIGSLEAVPLSYRDQWWDIVVAGPPFRFFDWRGAEWKEMFPQVPAEKR